MEDDFGIFDTDTPAPTPDQSGDGKAGETPELVYGSAEEFLHEQLLPTYVRDVDDRSAKWCVDMVLPPRGRLPGRGLVAVLGTLPP